VDNLRKKAERVRAEIAKAVFEDKVSSRDIDEVEFKIIERALSEARNEWKEERAKLVERIRKLKEPQNG